MKVYDVAIIGGGLLGSAFGLGLSELGMRTTVLDEGDNAIRTARGNFGLVWVQSKGVGMLEYARWTLLSSQKWTGFADKLLHETGVDVRYHRPGGFGLCLDENDFEHNTHQLEILRRGLGESVYDYEILEHAELQKQIPFIGKIPGASYTPHDGHCDPLRLLRALHQGCLNNGADYRPHTHVRRVDRSGGEFRLLDDAGKTICAANKVIVSAGHGSKELGAQIGLNVPIYPDQGQVLVTEKVQPILEYPTTFVRQTDDGTFMLGPSTRNAGYDLTTDTPTLQEICQRCVKAFPLLKKLRIQRAWAALRIMTPDGFPVYQQSDSHPGAFSFACHSGVTLTAVHAMDVSRWVMDGVIPDEFSVFHPDRFDVQAT